MTKEKEIEEKRKEHREYCREYRKIPKNHKKHLEMNKRWRRNNKGYSNKYYKRRLKEIELKGFLAGQNSQKEKDLEIVGNQRIREGIHYLKGWTILEELTQKIKGDDLKNEIIKIVTEDLDLGKGE